MPKRSRNRNANQDEEPPSKRHCNSSDNSKKSYDYFVKKEHKRPIGLGEIPLEVFMDICDNINIWHHNRIRSTSKHLRDANNSYIMHTFLKQYHLRMSQDPKSYRSVVMLALRTATEVYIQGYETTFCGCILPMLRKSREDPFCPRIPLITAFLLHFYKLVDERTAENKKQHSRLLSVMTLIKLLKHFPTFRIISETLKPLHCRVIFEFNRSWIGILCSRVGKEENKRNGLIVMIANLLIESLAGNCFKRFWRCFDDIYVFGNDTGDDREPQKIPKTQFIFTVHGTQKMCTLFHSWLVGLHGIECPMQIPNDMFTILVEVRCNEAARLGCGNVMRFEFGPLAETMQILHNSIDEL